MERKLITLEFSSMALAARFVETLKPLKCIGVSTSMIGSTVVIDSPVDHADALQSMILDAFRGAGAEPAPIILNNIAEA